MQSLDPLPLSIARHSIQFIWQSILATQQRNHIGLLGSQIKQQITTATHMPLWKVSPSLNKDHVSNITKPSSKLHQAFAMLSQAWTENNTALMGIYQCSEPNIDQMRSHEALLQSYFNPSESPFIHLHIHFNTKGVLESQAWILKDQQAHKIALLLCEDGQPATKS